MKILQLFLRMLRYRVAILLLLFFFFGIASEHALLRFSYTYILGIISLCASYVGATTLNDIADYNIDLINHKNNPNRPLVSKAATVSDLYKVHILSLFLTILPAIFIGISASIVIICSITINYLYSVKPFQISYRTHFAHFFLAIAYVVLPFTLGIIVTKNILSIKQIPLLITLLLLFFGRIFLKDFRDREGDKRYGKPTFLLNYGKKPTLFISFMAVAIANLIVFFVLNGYVLPLVLGAFLEVYFLSIYFIGYKLWKTRDQQQELIFIGIGAKVGNYLIIALLSTLLLKEYHSALYQQIVFQLLLLAMWMYQGGNLLRKPGYALLGYKG